MKAIYTFMIGLVLFNFYACTKQQTYYPKVNDAIENSKLEITYLDANNKPTDNKTETILMKLKDDESGFIMVSRNTGKEDGIEEYTTSLIDTANKTSISMVYTNHSEFPHKILLADGENETMIGYTSAHRKDTQDFDIIWYAEDGYGESSENIPLETTIYRLPKTTGVETDTDYQIKTIKISVKIADSINKYVEGKYKNNIEENPDDSNEYNPLFRAKWWSKFCSIWKKIVTPIVIAVAVVVAVVVPIVIPASTAIVLGVTGGVSGAVAGLAVLFDQIDNGIQSSPGEKALLITRDGKEDYYQEGDIIYLEKVGDETYIHLDILDEPVNYLKVRLYRDNDNEPHRMASAYFDFYVNETRTNLTSEYIINYGKVNNDKDVHIKIKKRELKDDLNLFIIIETGNNVMINRGSSSQLKLKLK